MEANLLYELLHLVINNQHTLFILGILFLGYSSLIATETSRRDYDIPAGDAAETLQSFVEQSGEQVFFFVERVRGYQTNSLKGTYMSSEALALLLEGSQLNFVTDMATGAVMVRSEDSNHSDSRIAGGNEPSLPIESTQTQQKDTTEMTTNRNNWLSRLGAALAVAVGSTQVSAQEASEEVYELSPFTVESSEEVGYQATSTLAGTRIKTDLGDLPNSITVATKEFMEDLNVNDATNLLPFLGNIETSGIDGTFSGGNTSNSAIVLEGVNRNPENNNRIRGLASADSSRNYMPTSISFDSYNTDRVTVNRGPNSILFGLGSPGGIVDNAVISPSLVDRTKLEVTLSSWDSYRVSFDVERTLVEGKLGIRVAGLMDRQQWRQAFSFEDDDRLTVAALYRPFENANLRFTFEKGEIDARRPRPNSPRHALLWWWDAPFGQVTHSPYDDEFGTIDRDIVRAPGAWFFQPALVYENDGGDASRLNYAWEDTRRDGARFRAFTVGLTKGDQWYPSPTAAASGIEFGSFYQDEEIIDRTVFDWVERRLDGPNAFEKEDFDVMNISYDQSWEYSLGSYGFELSYMEEAMERGWFDLLGGGRGYFITLDINTTLNWGAPNPNFGRPYVASQNNRQQNNIDREVKRGTAFFEIDAKEGVEGLLGGILGRHTGTIFAQEYEIDRATINGRNLVDPAYALASNNQTNMTSGAANARTQMYVGPSLLGRTSAAGANLPGITQELRTASTTGWYWDNDAPGDGSGDGDWVQRQVIIGDVRDNDTFYRQIHSRSLNRQITDSEAYIHQVYFLDQEWLIGTYGRRTDEVTTYGSAADRDEVTRLWDPFSQRVNDEPSGEVFKATTESYGGVVKVPDFVPLPDGVDLQFHWGESENFQISAPRIDVFGGLIAPPQGTTEDYGFTLGLMDNKFQIKMNWYETVAGNVSFGYPGFLFETDRRIIRYNTQEARDAAGYVGPPDFYKQLTNWEIVDGATTDSGQNVEQSGPNFQLTDTQSTASEGKEIDLIYNPTDNWRIILNLSQQQATTANIAPTAQAYLEYRLDEWTNTSNPASFLIADESDQPVNVRVFDTLLNNLNSALAREGQLVGELREWRANLVTNYRFDSNSALRGWSVGGALRWEDDKAVGYPITLQTVDGQQLALPDLGNAYTDDPIERVDIWIGHERKLNDKINWKVQLNLTNVFSSGEIITTAVQPNGQARAVTWREGRQFRLRSTFSF